MSPSDAAPDPGLLSAAELRHLVSAFYGAIRTDELLAPLFEGQVADWPAHLKRLGDFWCSVMLGSGSYKGNPFGAHLPLRGALEPAHFERWLSLFHATADREFGADRSAAISQKADRIADSLKAGLLFRAAASAARPPPIATADTPVG
jgi:hemoglobin